mgnify:FL=1
MGAVSGEPVSQQPSSTRPRPIASAFVGDTIAIVRRPRTTAGTSGVPPPSWRATTGSADLLAVKAALRMPPHLRHSSSLNSRRSPGGEGEEGAAVAAVVAVVIAHTMGVADASWVRPPTAGLTAAIGADWSHSCYQTFKTKRAKMILRLLQIQF